MSTPSPHSPLEIMALPLVDLYISSKSICNILRDRFRKCLWPKITRQRRICKCWLLCCYLLALDNLSHTKHLRDLPLKYYFLAINSGGSRIFPRGGREPSRGGVNTPNFPENCMKSKEFGRPGGGVRPSRPPLDPPMINTSEICPVYLSTLTIFTSEVLFLAINSSEFRLVNVHF